MCWRLSPTETVAVKIRVWGNFKSAHIYRATLLNLYINTQTQLFANLLKMKKTILTQLALTSEDYEQPSCLLMAPSIQQHPSGLKKTL